MNSSLAFPLSPVSSLSPLSPLSPSDPLYCRTLYACLLVLVLVPAAVGNLSLVLTLLWTRDQPDFRGSRELRGPCPSFTLSLSLSDLVLSLTVVPGAVYCAAAGVRSTTGSGVWCQTGGFVLVLLQTSSLQSRMWTAVGQFSEIRLALSYGRLWTSCRIRVLVLLLWIYSVASAALPVVGVGKYSFSAARCVCGLDLLDPDPVSRAVSLSWVIVSMATPLMLTCGLQGYVVHVARRQARRGTFRCNEMHCFYVPAQAYERSSKALLTGTVTLLTCWLPYLSACLYEALSLDLAPELVSQISMFLVLSSCAVAPWVTCLTHTQYRAAALLAVSRLAQLCPRSPAPRPVSANQISTTTTSLPGSSGVPMENHDVPT